MPTNWIGTVSERYARLDFRHRRCDGNNRQCVKAASASFDLRPATDGVAIADAEPVRRQSCSRHVQQFVNSANFVVMGQRRLSNERPAGKPHAFTVY